MNPILQALSSGIGINKILQYLSKSSPALANKISTAVSSGFTANQILKYVMKGGKSISNMLPNPSKDDMNIYNQMQYSVPEDIKTAGKMALAAGGAIGAIGANFLSSKPAPISSSMPQGPTPQPPPVTPAQPIQPGPAIGQQVGQNAQQPIAQAMQPAAPNQVAQAAQAIQPKQPQSLFNQLMTGVDISKLQPDQVEQLKFLNTVSDQLQAKGKGLNDPEVQNLAKKVQDTVKGKAKLAEQEISRFNQAYPQDQSKTARTAIEIQKEEKIPYAEAARKAEKEKLEIPESIIEPIKIDKPKSISKGESVITEDGNLAEVKGISGNNFLIEENGKVRQVPMDSLRAQPEAIKKAKIVFDHSKIPEEDKSAALSISIPMPDRSGIINMFHDGTFYLYKRKDGKPLDESIIKRVIEGQDIPISSGETFMGAWNNEKGDSRGSAAHKELTAMAQSLEDIQKQDDPNKPLTFEKITNSYTHGYLKEFMKLLKETGKEFSAKPKKPKK